MAKATKQENSRVPVSVPRGRPGEDPNLFISVNGINYLLPRGDTSLVPPEIAEEYRRARSAEDAFYDEMDRRAEQNRADARAAMGY